MSSLEGELQKLEKKELWQIFQDNGIWYDRGWKKKRLASELVVSQLTKEIDFPDEVMEGVKGTEIEIPKPSFSPGEVVIAISIKGSEEGLNRKVIPYYGYSVKDGAQLGEEVTREAIQIYCHWLVNDYASEEYVVDRSFLNASGDYLVAVDLEDSEDSRKIIQKTREATKGRVEFPFIYPDIATSMNSYHGELGFPVINNCRNKKPERSLVDFEETTRDEYLKDMSNIAEYIGHSDISDPYRGEKFKSGNCITFVGSVGAVNVGIDNVH